MCSEGLGYQPTDEAEIERWRQKLVERGVSRETADQEIKRELERDFLHKGRELSHRLRVRVYLQLRHVPNER